MAKKIKVAVATGGFSSEREISLLSGRNIVQNLNPKKYSVKTYDLKKELSRFFFDAKKKKIDLVFIALHGKGGEDGSIQGLLDILKIPYTGSGILASAIGMNKTISKKFFKEEGILTPQYIIFDRDDYSFDKKIILKKIKTKLNFPCVVKPSNGGSSIAVSIVKTFENLEKAVKKAFKESDDVIIEKYILGREISVPVLGNKKPQVLPIIEIRPKRHFFDFKAKYNPGACQEIIPAEISKVLTNKAQSLAKKIHLALGCRGFSRTDMILSGNKIYALETNTIPGLTENSLLPKSARAAGISFPRLLDKIIKLALNNEN